MQQCSHGIQEFNSTRQEELAASQAALDAALAEGRQQRQLLQQREAEAVELARAVEDARKGVAQVRVLHKRQVPSPIGGACHPMRVRQLRH